MAASEPNKQSTPTCTPTPSRPPTRGRFAQLIAEIRRKRSRQGIVEIDSNHGMYELATCIQDGLSWIPEANMDVEKCDLKTEDFSEVIQAKLVNKDSNKKFLFKSFAPKVFVCLRRNLDISEDFYQESLSPDKPDSLQQQVFLQFLSNSKSGQEFFLCNNKHYMIKTEKKDDVLFFLKILSKYFAHLEHYPHSLMVRYFGLHFIKIQGHKGHYFTVMQSVFCPDERIRARYDLKGCEANRYEEPEPEDSEVITVLKDTNLGTQALQLGSQKDWFCRQASIDSNFLEDLGVMDYSLLMGHHKLHQSEIKKNKNMAEVVLRVSKSFKLRQMSRRHSLPSLLPQHVHTTATSTSHIYGTDVHSSDSELVANRSNTFNIPRSNSGTAPSAPMKQNASDPSVYTDKGKSAFIGVDCNKNEGAVETQQQCKFRTDPISQNGITHDQSNSCADLDDSILPGMVDNCSTASLLHHKSGRSPSGAIKSRDFKQLKDSSDHSNSDAMSQTTSSSIYEQQTSAQNLRLLPNVTNAVHTIDGPTDRYFVGIIDVFTVYGTKKKFEHLVKSVIYPTISFSTVNPSHYSSRFQQFLHSHCD